MKHWREIGGLKGASQIGLATIACAFLLAMAPTRAGAQAPVDMPPPPPPEEPTAPPPAAKGQPPKADSSKSNSPSKSGSSGSPSKSGSSSSPGKPETRSEPVFDPLHANKDIEVGMFYMKKGNFDAAIERFKEATTLQPKLARPYQLLGEAYEKKGDLDKSIESYRKYLEVYRTAPDKEKMQKKIEKLESEARRAQSRAGSVQAIQERLKAHSS